LAPIKGEALIQYPKQQKERLSTRILNFCRHVAGSCQIIATCLGDDYDLGLSDTKTSLEVLLIIRDFQPRLMNYVKVFDEKPVIVFAVDQWIFERDVDRGFLGEALVSELIFPYFALIGGDYLHTQEVKLKRRLILELMENIVLGFPEFCYDIHIKPQYFMFEAALNRVRLFPPIIYSLSFLRGSERKKHLDSVFRGYSEALALLEKEGLISFSDDYVKIPRKFVEGVKSQKARFIRVSKIAPRALFTSLLEIFPQILSFLSQNADAFLRLQRPSDTSRHLVDPQRFLYIPTAHGLVSLGEKIDIEAFVRRVLSAGKDSKVEIKGIGGVLNDVYLIKTFSNGEEYKAVVKRFKDWSSFKWFPLTLWTVGARSFAVIGRSRLERECAINEFLLSKGFNVPKVLCISHDERLIFTEYIEGEGVDKTIKRIGKLKNEIEAEKDLHLMAKVGETMARVHSFDVCLGDTKPENIMLGKDGKIYLVDFEQASRRGDRVWDVAEFLYYSGHYLSPLYGNVPAERITKAFIKGYFRAGGDVKIVKEAGSPKYTRVFSVFTFPSIMLVISNICKNAEALR